MTYKTSCIGFMIALAVTIILFLIFRLSVFWLTVPCIVFMALKIYGASCIQSDFYTHAYCEGKTSEKIMALTFDDGPNEHYTPQVLDLLAQYKVPATFFVIGKNIKGNENILKKINAEGHIIGNHSYTHSYWIDFKSVDGIKKELSQTTGIVYQLTGKVMRLFRPPYGVITPNLATASNLLNYGVIGWNIRSFDTTKDSAQTISQRIEQKIKPGAIVLLHDTTDKIVQVVEQTLMFAKENGYQIVSLEQLLQIEAYE
jgi:peptidoglycan/xylan/chitin deacetylase (PgdA/CDA1 family)